MIPICSEQLILLVLFWEPFHRRTIVHAGKERQGPCMYDKQTHENSDADFGRVVAEKSVEAVIPRGDAAHATKRP
jgi:hypothetical protein